MMRPAMLPAALAGLVAAVAMAIAASGGIGAALKKYGMFVADNGPDWFISGAPDPRRDDDDLGDLTAIPGPAFEVVATGEPVVAP